MSQRGRYYQRVEAILSFVDTNANKTRLESLGYPPSPPLGWNFFLGLQTRPLHGQCSDTQIREKEEFAGISRQTVCYLLLVTVRKYRIIEDIFIYPTFTLSIRSLLNATGLLTSH